MQLQGHAEVMVPISLVALNNRGPQDRTGAVPSRQTLDRKNQKSTCTVERFWLVTDENIMLFSRILPPVLSNTTGCVPLIGRFFRVAFGSAPSAD